MLGGIAQLVERLNGIQEVRGSTPLVSTIDNHIRTHSSELVVFFCFIGYFSKVATTFYAAKAS